MVLSSLDDNSIYDDLWGCAVMRGAALAVATIIPNKINN